MHNNTLWKFEFILHKTVESCSFEGNYKTHIHNMYINTHIQKGNNLNLLNTSNTFAFSPFLLTIMCILSKRTTRKTINELVFFKNLFKLKSVQMILLENLLIMMVFSHLIFALYSHFKLGNTIKKSCLRMPN